MRQADSRKRCNLKSRKSTRQRRSRRREEEEEEEGEGGGRGGGVGDKARTCVPEHTVSSMHEGIL